MTSILYADDEETLLEVTRVYLERTGEFTVATCTSAQEAIGMLEAGSFDAVISDYQMPGMDGLAFLKHLRSKNNGVPFILFTGKGREEVAIEALNSGADFYLQKGGEPNSQYAELASKIRQAVQRRRAEEALSESEEKYRDLVENINDVLFVIDRNSTITYISPRISQFGYAVDEVIGRPVSAFVAPDDLPRVQERFREIEKGDLHPFEFRLIDGSGKPRFVRTSSRPVFTMDNFSGIHGVMTDITSVRVAEEKISAGEQRYRNVFEAAGDAMLVVDRDRGDILDANRAASYIFGFTPDEFRGMKHSDLLAEIDAHEGEAQNGIFGVHLRYYRTREGSIFPADVLSSEYPWKKRTITILSIRNITEQILAEKRVLAAGRLYAVLSQINQTIVRTKDLPSLLADICRISVEYGKFRMAWIGLLDHDSLLLRPVAHAGHEDGYLSVIEPCGDDEQKRASPVGTAVREGRYDTCNNIESDPRVEPWRDEALKRGYRSFCVLPFRLHGEVVGVYVIYASQKNFFNSAEIALLEEIADDISFALDMLDEQARRTKAEKALAGSEEKVRTLAMILEHSSQPFGIGYPDGRFGIVNPALCDLLGYPEDELQQMNWTDLTVPEFAGRENAAIGELIRTGVPQRYEKEYFTKDGRRVPVEMFVHRVPETGENLQYFYAFVTDITEQKQGKEAIQNERDLAQQYLDMAGVMIAVLDTQGKITRINRRGLEILGYTEEELSGRDWITTCLPQKVQDEVRSVFDQICRGDIVPVEYHENPVIRKDGEERILAFHNTLLKDDHARVTGILFSGEDITLRKQAEGALLGSEERFRNLVQGLSDMIWIIDRNGHIAYSSPSALRTFGYDPREVVGKDPLEYIHSDDRKRVKDALEDVCGKTDAGTPTEFRIRHAGGQYFDVEAIVTNLLDVIGIDGIVITVRPITERKTRERSLLVSEGRYRALFEKSADAIFVMSDRFPDCNPAAERLFGYSRGEIIGKDPLTFSPPEQPGGRASADLAADSIRKARAGSPQCFGWMHKTRNGRIFPSEVTLIPVLVQGEDQLIVIVHDRSVEDSSDMQCRHLARFAEQSPDPIIEIDSEKNIIYANPATRAVLKNLGMSPDPAAFIPADFDSLVSDLVAAGGSPLTREIRIGTALFSLTISYDKEDKRVRISSFEVTTRSFETSALEQANRKLNLLSGMTRHDIKNKLTGVMGYLELAKGSTKDPELIEYLSRVEFSATAIRQQIEFTKEYENLGVKRPLWQELAIVLEAVIKMIDPGPVAVENEAPGLFVYADPMLDKVLSCLVENAKKHGETITKIRISGTPVPAGYLLVVEDDGVGVPADRKEKIFNKNVGKGSGGFGLFLAREILSITGITIAETGEPGAGARFEISIPSGKFR